jgi:hypothetical protein
MAPPRLNRELEMFAPVQHAEIKIRQGMTNIHDQENAFQALSMTQKAFDHGPPGLLDGLRNLGVPVSRKIDDSAGSIKIKEIQELGSTRGLTDTRKVALLGQNIDAARLASI